jgi:hypothetical protein
MPGKEPGTFVQDEPFLGHVRSIRIVRTCSIIKTYVLPELHFTKIVTQGVLGFIEELE